MATEVRWRRGTAAEHESFTGAPAEVSVDTTNNELRVHDGETPGGHRTLMEQDVGDGPEQLPTNQRVNAAVAAVLRAYEYELALTPVANEPAPESYKNEPNLVLCDDGSILCVYRRGSGHVENTGRVVSKRSVDYGRSWGPEELVHKRTDVAADTRNATAGKDPDTGRIIVFSRSLDASIPAHLAIYFQTSDDHGRTWSTAHNISSLFADVSANFFVPFGPIVSTSNGLMQLVYATRTSINQDLCYALFSTDGGLTWGNRALVYNDTRAGAQLAEPIPVAVDENRIVVLIRDEVSDKRQGWRYVKSGDGGLTWTAVGDAFGYWTDMAIAGAVPCWGIRFGKNDVLLSWGSRGEGAIDNPGYIYTSQVNKEIFWDHPPSGWSADNPTRRRLSKSKITNEGGASWGEFGYPCLLELPGVHHTAMVAWYDSTADENRNDTDIWVMSTPRT